VTREGPQKRRYRRVLTGIAVSAVTTATVGLAAATPAFASAPAIHPDYSSYVDSYYYSGVNLRTCGNTGCGSIHYMPDGTGVTMRCWEDTQSVSPPNSNYTSSRWFEVSSPWTLASSTPPWCSTHGRSKIVLRGLNHDSWRGVAI